MLTLNQVEDGSLVLRVPRLQVKAHCNQPFDQIQLTAHHGQVDHVTLRPCQARFLHSIQNRKDIAQGKVTNHMLEEKTGDRVNGVADQVDQSLAESLITPTSSDVLVQSHAWWICLQKVADGHQCLCSGKVIGPEDIIERGLIHRTNAGPGDAHGRLRGWSGGRRRGRSRRLLMLCGGHEAHQWSQTIHLFLPPAACVCTYIRMVARSSWKRMSDELVLT